MTPACPHCGHPLSKGKKEMNNMNETIEWRNPEDPALKAMEDQDILVMLKEDATIDRASYVPWYPKGKSICIIRGCGEEYFRLSEIVCWSPLPKGPSYEPPPRKEPKKQKAGLKLESEDYQALKGEAEAQGMELSDFVRKAVRQSVEQNEARIRGGFAAAQVVDTVERARKGGLARWAKQKEKQ